MSDDIVIRLRMSAGLMEGFPYMKAKNFNAEWVAEAADELERLRSDRDRWRDAAHTLADHIANTSSDSPAETILLDAYEQAVRDA